MKKLFIPVILISILLWLILFLYAFKNYRFNSDAIWKIEEQRREHVYTLPSMAKFIHNKGIYFTLAVFENYLYFLSPSVFFYCNLPLLLGVFACVIFYSGIFVMLKSSSKLAKMVLLWTLLYPAFIALLLLGPSPLLLLPLLIPASGFLIYHLQ